MASAWLTILVLLALVSRVWPRSVQAEAIYHITRGGCNVQTDLELCAQCRVLWNFDCENITHSIIVGYDSGGEYNRNPVHPYNLATLSPYFGNLSNLLVLSIESARQLTGTVPTEFARLTKLLKLDIRVSPGLSGTLPLSLLPIGLQSLTLTNTGLTGTLPAGLGTLTALQVLDLRHNSLTGTIPSELRSLSQLYSLGLGTNLLSGEVPDFFAQMPKLYQLDLSRNSFEGTIPLSISKLTVLLELHLDFNLFSGTIPPQLGDLSRIGVMSMANNPLTGTVPAELFTKFTRLNGMYLGNCRLTGTIPTTIGMRNPGKFEYLSLSNNTFTGTIPTEFGRLTSLIYFGLDNNRFTNFPTELGRMANATVFLLQSNRITGVLPQELVNIKNMNIFRVSDNFMSGHVPNFAVGWQFIDYFEISNNYFTSGDFLNWPDRGNMVLRASGNQFTSLDITCNYTRPSNFLVPRFRTIDFSSNRLTVLPKFVFDYPGVCRIETLILSKNRITTSDLTGLNPSILSLDVSYNYIKLETDVIKVFTPILASAEFTCLCQYEVYKLFNPLVRNLNLVANRIDYDFVLLMELMGYPDRRNFCGPELCNQELLEVDSYATFTILPQDKDECNTTTHQCQHLCLDGWYPILDYTCGCKLGYKPDSNNTKRCQPICGDGLLQVEEECDSVYSLHGCAGNCSALPGYNCYPATNDSAGGCAPICGDGLLSAPEECDDGNRNNGDGCSAACAIETDYTCPVPGRLCELCHSEWLPLPVNGTALLFPRFRALGYKLDGFPFTACTLCSGGVAFESRYVSSAASCHAVAFVRSSQCAFACSNLTVFSSAKESLYTLQQQLVAGNFLNEILTHFFGVSVVNVTLNAIREGKRAVGGRQELFLNLTACSGNNTNASMSRVMDAILALAADIVPNAPGVQLSASNCDIALVSTDPVALSSSNVTGIVVGVVCAFAALLLLLAASLLAYYYMRSDLHQLPEGIRWSYIHKVTHPWAWSYNGSKSTGYYERQYAAGSAEWQRVETLLVQQLHCKMAPTDIYAVYNPSLTSSFINHWHVTLSRYRSSHDQFFHDTYGKNERKLAVMEHYEQLVRRFEWNQGNKQTEDVPLLAALHGTDYHIAEKIAQTGFAALSSLDAGFFGKGIYFTSHFSYCLPYCFMKRSPAVLLAYCNLGHVFPVTEDHKDKEKSLVGAALKSGYSSHYVITTKHGNCFDPTKDDMTRSCDEIVIGQESQILPAFIIALNVDTAQHQLDKWNRELPSEKCVTQVPHSVLLESAVNGDDLHVQLSELSRETRSNLKERRISLDDSGRAGQNIQLLGTNSNIYSAATERGANPLNVDSETNERYFLL